MANYLAPEHLDALYVSPQQRAIETAAPLAQAKGLTPVVVDGIAEFDLGHPSYIPGEDADPLTPEQSADLVAQVTSAEFVGRVRASIDSIIGNHPGETVAAVCHGGVISTILNDVLGLSGGSYHDAHYTSVTRIRASRTGRRSMTSFNECPWLRDL